ncbi:hypothetical protein [Psychrobacter sp. UBA3480]|uniref:hypothetical protein n=1 Tax=Psychrobacter sp. UBA3480 TaxID=1947350 RepID=UPI0025ED2265|nr:hypothetical protein [Psychrobacter sp. UBA3480]
MKPVRKPTSQPDAAATPRPSARPSARPGARPAGAGGKLEKTPKKKFEMPGAPVLVGVAFGLVVLIFVTYMLWPASTPDTAVVANDIAPQETVDEFPVDAAPIYPEGYYLASPTPIQELGRQATQKALTDHSAYVAGQGLVLANGVTLGENTPELIMMRDGVAANTTQQLQSMTQTQVDPTTGNAVILVRDDATGQMTPLSVSTQATAFEAQAYRIAATNLDAEILNQSNGAAQNVVAVVEPVVEKQIIVESVLDDTEKRKYLDLIETQERENERLRDKIADVQDDMLDQRKQVIDVMQRIEDSPIASQRLRATMLPKSTGLTQQGIVGDRVWYADQEGRLTTYRIGEVINGTELRIASTDEATNTVLVTPK